LTDWTVKVKTPEEAREWGLSFGSSAGEKMREEVDRYIDEENFGLARERQKRLWRSIEEMSQYKMGRFSYRLTLHAAHRDSIHAPEPPAVVIKRNRQDVYDAFVSAFKEGALAAFGGTAEE
jgi:hypothetical protein